MSEEETNQLIDAHARRGDVLLAQIDAHLKRGIRRTSPQHLARGAELELRLAWHLARPEEAILARSGEYEGWRLEMRRDALHNERVLGEISESLVQRTHEFVRYFIDEGPAHRDALRKVLDAFDRNAGRQPNWPLTAPSYRG